MSQYEKEKAVKDQENVLELLRLFHNCEDEVESYNFCEIQIAENPTFAHYGTRHLGLSDADDLEIQSCEKRETDNELNFVLKLRNNDISVEKNYYILLTSRHW